MGACCGAPVIQLKACVGSEHRTPRSLSFRSPQRPPPLNRRFKSSGSAAGVSLPESFTPDLARFCGLLIAEGRSTNANQIRFVNSDRAINDEFEKLSSDLFDVKVSRQQYKPLAEDGLIYSRR